MATLQTKTCYPSAAKARKFARLSHDKAPTHPILRTYQCPSCGAWHITKQPQPTRGPHDRRAEA